MASPLKKTYRYTLRNNLLTDEQRQFYEDNGYLVIPRLFDHATLDRFSKRFDDLAAGRVPLGEANLMKEVSYVKQGRKDDPFATYKIQFLNYDEVFKDYVTHSKLLDYVECFVGPNISARHSMAIFKSPDLGTLSSLHPPHQDGFYFNYRPFDRCVATWTAMGKVTAQNGCLYVYPGSHKEGKIYPHQQPTSEEEGGANKAFLGIQDYLDHPRPKMMVEMEQGDTVFFHPLLIHGSGLNLTKGYRKAVTCHFSTSDYYTVDLKGTLQEPAVKAGEEIYAAQGENLSYAESWERRERVVRPEPKEPTLRGTHIAAPMSHL